MGREYRLECVIQSRTFGDNFIELFVIHEKNLCKAANTFLGEFWYDIQRAAQAIPGMCPIPSRRYHIRHLELDFRIISLQTFPFGKLRFFLKPLMNKNSEILCCLLMEVENLPE
ncbi:hypothetical protein ILUMI_14788 [Ignelater luminosus]|uniref:Uncharacterized protein n=1 Tax=Ignelater luminosus TaxID=2038154 RepID=A0A8K0CXX8_IGNLU|nr:hypothetical protein ILUMI_14788 [Ignelater luminosus]